MREKITDKSPGVGKATELNASLSPLSADDRVAIDGIMGRLKEANRAVVDAVGLQLREANQPLVSGLVKEINRFLSKPSLENIPELTRVAYASSRIFTKEQSLHLVPTQIALLRFTVESVPEPLRGTFTSGWPDDSPMDRGLGSQLQDLTHSLSSTLQQAEPGFEELLSPSTTDDLKWLHDQGYNFHAPELPLDLLSQSPVAGDYLDAVIDELTRYSLPANTVNERFQRRMSGMPADVVPKLFDRLSTFRQPDQEISEENTLLELNILVHLGSRVNDLFDTAINKLENDDSIATWHAVFILSEGGTKLPTPQADIARQKILDQNLTEEREMAGAVVGALAALARTPEDLQHINSFVGRNPQDVPMKVQRFAAQKIVEALSRFES